MLVAHGPGPNGGMANAAFVSLKPTPSPARRNRSLVLKRSFKIFGLTELALASYRRK